MSDSQENARRRLLELGLSDDGIRRAVGEMKTAVEKAVMEYKPRPTAFSRFLDKSDTKHQKERKG